MNDASLMELLDEAYCCAMGGELDRATAAVAAARRWAPLREGSLESMDVMLVEGVVHTYRGEIEAARSRLSRVTALAPLLPQSEAPLQAWAWLALLDYNQGEVLSAAEALAKACAQPERAGPRTRMRASVNAALLCEFAGLRAAGRNWMTSARLATLGCGVPGLVGLIVYGIAAVRVTAAAVENLRVATSASDATSLLLQVESAIHYDRAVGVSAQPMLNLLIHAMALRLSRRPIEAIPLLQRFLETDNLTAVTDQLSARVELIACQVACNAEFRDLETVGWLERSVSMLVDPGERAHAYSLLKELHYRACIASEIDWGDRVETELAQHDALGEALANRLTSLGLTTIPAAWTTPGADAPHR